MRLYSVVEARALLPRVIPVLEQLRTAFVELRALQATIELDSRGSSGDGNLLVDPWHKGEGTNRLEELNRELRRAARQLGDWEIELKDPERGLIDFHHERDGEIVYLCFQLGESDITHWHRLKDGFAGRQPL